MEKTVALIKPDAVKAHHIGEIIAMMESSGLVIKAMEFFLFTRKEAEGFYSVHAGKHFFDNLIDYMTSGPLVALVLEGDGAIKKWRDLMGPTDPTKAGPKTIRGKFGRSITFNATHGSDAVETAAYEMSYLFGGRYLNGIEG
jgi:nucleoside-diphosphate kinase